MTRENAKDYLPLVQAWADGKTIQYRHKHATGGVWLDVKTDITFGEPLEHYRIKPEPRERWVIHAPGLCECGPFKTEAEAKEWAKNEIFTGRAVELIHLKEVQ